MSTTNLSPVLRQRFFDSDGAPLAGGKVYSYQAGTTTPQATYTDQTGVTPNTNPVILDADGYADIWLNPALSYKFVLKDALGALIWTVDNVVGSLVANSVTTASIQDGAVTTPKLADGAVTLTKISSQVFGPDALLNFGLAAAVSANNLVITLKDGTGMVPNASSVVRAAFRDATATTGTPVFRDVTSAITGSVLSGSTLGSVNAKANWIYVYLLDSAGTVEFAWSASKQWDEGSLQSTTADGGTATSKNALYSNIARSGVAVRLVGRVKSTQATAGTWVTAPSEISAFPFEQDVPRSEIWLKTWSANAINGQPRFTTVARNYGSAITYTDDATNGAFFTVNEDGIYSMSLLADGVINQLQTSAVSLNPATPGGPTFSEMLGYNQVGKNAATDNASTLHATAVLKAGDLLYLYNGGGTTPQDPNAYAFRITKVSG